MDRWRGRGAGGQRPVTQNGDIALDIQKRKKHYIKNDCFKYVNILLTSRKDQIIGMI